MGAEKVAALTNCCELSKKWLQAAPDTAEKKRAQEAFTKLSSILKQLSTEQVFFEAYFLHKLCLCEHSIRDF